MVELVIVARQMQHAVENQNLEFIGSRVTVTASTGQSDIGGDGNIAPLDTGEGKKVRGLSLLSETAGPTGRAGAHPRERRPIHPAAAKTLSRVHRKGHSRAGPTPHHPHRTSCSFCT